jgi:SpoVK/Ycf46/Vps4 family AAA+-type ATPase
LEANLVAEVPQPFDKIINNNFRKLFILRMKLLVSESFLLIRFYSSSGPGGANVKNSPKYTAGQFKRTRKGSAANEKSLPNLFASDLSIDSPFGPSLINDLKQSESSKAKETLNILTGKYYLPAHIINQVTALGAGCLEFQPVPAVEKSRIAIPVLYLNYTSIAASQLMSTLVEHMSHSLNTELLNLNSRRIVQIGKAMSRFIRPQPAPTPKVPTDEEIQLMNKLQLRQEANNSGTTRLLHLHSTFTLGRSTLRDYFLPGLGYIIKSLCTHSSSLPKIILIRDLPSFFESPESKRALYDWIQDLYTNDVEMPPVMLTGFDFSCCNDIVQPPPINSPNASPTGYSLDVPSNPSPDPLEMEVYRYRLAQNKLLSIIQKSNEDSTPINGGGAVAQSPKEAQNLASQMFSRIWLPSKPKSCSIDEGGAITFSISPPINSSQARLFENQMRKEENEIIFKWNWLQILKSLSSEVSQPTNNEIINLLSQKLLHEDEIEAINVLAKGKIFGTTNEQPSADDIYDAVKMFYSNQAMHSAQNSLRSQLDRLSLGKYERKFLPVLIQPGQLNVRFEDVGALDTAKTLLKEIIAMPIKNPELFSVGILKESVSGVLLFGPPGTGKSLLAKAVANECNASFLAINLASIFEMWVGEGEKNIKGLFSLARKLSPCVIFLDEVDALLQSRSISLHARSGQLEVFNEFMMEWDGINSELNRGVIIMAATNRPFALDDAVLRRLPRRILIDLPDEQARLKILQILLKEDQIDKDVILTDLAKRTAGYSGSDLKNICKAAAFNSRRRGEFTLLKEDFEKATTDISPSVSDEMQSISMLRKWDEKFGESSVHKRRAPKSIGF